MSYSGSLFFFLFLHSIFFKFKCLKCCIYLTVFLVGGKKENEGNLFMTNQQSKIHGPVCADYFWKIQNVSKASKNFKLYIQGNLKTQKHGIQIPRVRFNSPSLKMDHHYLNMDHHYLQRLACAQTWAGWGDVRAVLWDRNPNIFYE